MKIICLRKPIVLLIGILVFLFGCQPNKNLELPSVFSDNMVLQQQTDVAVWGKSTPGKKIEVTGSWGDRSLCKVNKDGKWMTYLHTPQAGQQVIQFVLILM